MKIPKAIFLDTNILLAASAPARASHERALEVLNAWPNDGVKLTLSGQIVREYLVVATRPTSLNGLGLKLEDALSNCQAIVARCQVLDETKAVSEKLQEIARETSTSGKQLHDANLVATAVVHGIFDILTQNIEDFRRFAPMIKLVAL